MYQLHVGSRSDNTHSSSWSFRIWLLMRQLDTPFEEISHDFQSNLEQQRAQWRRFSPNARIPVLIDADTVVWDSLAITEYFAERHQGVWPQDDKARTWARCAAAEMHSSFAALREQCSYRLDVTESPPVNEELRQDIERINELWCEGLQCFDGSFLAGNAFSAVDAFFAPVVGRLHSYQLLNHLEPAAFSYSTRMFSLPAMQKWTNVS
ncbi:glutathione S-transferase [Cardiobacteriaceae bacterium TAE3-ERU3]|nr:glutathione S-transferase [Cardiobacteriaceae bacterium TAE3-ERU3]